MNVKALIYPPDEERRLQIREYVDRTYSSVCVQSPARSLLGRDIDLYTVGSGKRNVMIVGAHHGAEYVTASLIYHFLLSLLEASSGEMYFGVSLSDYLSLYRLWIVPALNPDGIEISINGLTDNPLLVRQQRMLGRSDHRRWQSNARGVDLNHNYNVGFYEYKKIEEALGIEAGLTKFSGEYPESEPESAFLGRLFRTVMPSLVVSLHSQGEEIFAYPAGVADLYAEYLKAQLGYVISSPQGTARYGGFCDYTSAFGIPSLTVEVGRGENPIEEAELWKISDKLSRALFHLPLQADNC